MGDNTRGRQEKKAGLAGPPINTAFAKELDGLVAVARQGHRPNSPRFNPTEEWLLGRMPIFQDLAEDERARVLQEAERLDQEAAEANAAGKAAKRVWPGVAVRLDNGGLAFFSQLGVVRRPDLTQYYIDGFSRNRDALAFGEETQELFTEVLARITSRMKEHFASGEGIVQSDRQICDAPGRSFHARQLMVGGQYMHIPHMWRQLTFNLAQDELTKAPDIVELTIPNWLEDLGLPVELKARIKEAGLTQLIFKAPTKGLSLHLGFDYAGEHKMGPLSIAMFLVKQAGGLAVQAALSMARIRTLDGNMTNSALITVGPSLHGKSTLTIMIELANSKLPALLGLEPDPSEGVYPMNDDIVLFQALLQPSDVTDRTGKQVRITHGIDGTENNFYAVPLGLTREDDPITYDVLRGTNESPNNQELLENVPVDVESGTPRYDQNPVRNMRMILSRPRLLTRKGSDHLMETITDGTLKDSVHVPMEHTDRVLLQAVMRQNTVVPPLRRLSLKQYIRVLMYGEAVQMGAATGAIGRPYVEYFSDPFIIGLEDENANLLYGILSEMSQGGLTQEYYVFNTGGVGAETNEEASGPKYKKVPRELTLILQEAVLRGAVKFERDAALGTDIAVAIVNRAGETVVDLSGEWLPRNIYGDEEYVRRIVELRRRRYYGRDAQDKAGILRYTKVIDDLIDISDIPPPLNERELAWILSFYWKVDEACNSLGELVDRSGEGRRPAPDTLKDLEKSYKDGQAQGLELSAAARKALESLGISRE